MDRITIPPNASILEALALFAKCATPIDSEEDCPLSLVAKCKCEGKLYESVSSTEGIPCAAIIDLICAEIRLGNMSVRGLVPRCRDFRGGSWSLGDRGVAATVFSKDLGFEVDQYTSPFDALRRGRCKWDELQDRGESGGVPILRSHIRAESFPEPFVQSSRGGNDWYLTRDVDAWWERVLVRAKASALAKASRSTLKRYAKKRSCIYLVCGEPLEQAGLVGYIGQTVDYEARRHCHLVRGDVTTAGLIDTFRAKGLTIQMKIIKSCPPVSLNREEARWFQIYKKLGWTLWNRNELGDCTD